MSKIQTVSKILQIKEHKKEQAELEVKKITSLINKAEDKLSSLEKKFIETTEVFHQKQKSGTASIDEIGLFYNYFSQLNNEMSAKKKEISERHKELNIRQNELIEAYKEKRVFETLRDGIVARDIKEKDISEQKEMDFMFLAKMKY